LILFPNAKINLGLQVIAKRPDGYHYIASIFYPLQVTDVLEGLPAKEFSFQVSGLGMDIAPEQNLCYKAWKILEKDFNLPPVSLYLHKQIPMGAGLGGGSADGAFTLLLLQQLFKLDITQEKLIHYALQLGSDCPFFILNQSLIARGRGELMTPVELPQLKGKHFLLINPGIHIPTAWAFAQIKPAPAALSMETISGMPLEEWKAHLKNDFEPPVFAQYPQLAVIRDTLYQCGARYASMTGTGSTVYGIFDQLPENPEKFFEPGYRLIAI
jgi:4-diphosphocytidyl-2-C-methyl-D-erythritol kinase